MTYLVAKPYSPRGFHEKAWSCQPETRFFLPGNRNLSEPTSGRPRDAPVHSFIDRFFWPERPQCGSPTNGRRTFVPLTRALPLPPIRPASIRTLLWSSPAPVPFGVLNLDRALPSLSRSEGSVSEAFLPPRGRSRPNSAPGLAKLPGRQAAAALVPLLRSGS
jgi:hypothetical protein